MGLSDYAGFDLRHLKKAFESTVAEIAFLLAGHTFFGIVYHPFMRTRLYSDIYAICFAKTILNLAAKYVIIISQINKKLRSSSLMLRSVKNGGKQYA